MIPTLGHSSGRLSSGPGSKVAWQHSPLTTGLIDVENGVHNFSEEMFALSFLRINEFFYNFPLFISEVS